MLARDRAHLGLGAHLEWVGQHMDTQTRPPGVGGHGVGQVLELRCHDDDRRLASVGGRDGVVDAPGGAGASVAQSDDGDVDGVDELGELGERLLTFVADAVPGLPESDRGAGTNE